MNTGCRKVLIADCHENVLIALERVLEDSGYDTTTVWTGKEAFKALRHESFDLIVVNEYLPDTNAEDLIREAHRGDKDVRCIVMQPSAVRITDTDRFHAAGACCVVSKWPIENVARAVNAHLPHARHALAERRVARQR